MRRQGFTLLEVMVAVTILTVLLGTLFTLSLGLGDSARIQEISATHNDEARAILLTLVPLVHQAARSSINWDTLDDGQLRFRIATDVDGNGTAINSSGQLELGPEYLVTRDLEDLNEDGQTDTQLVLIQNEVATVLANHLTPLPAIEGAEISNAPGFRVVAQSSGVRIELQFEARNRLNQPVRLDIAEYIRPRN
jgi:prepilin-type N-terminal cleavage/methylation domain-containing protein